MHTVLTDKKFTSGNDYTHKKVNECGKKNCVKCLTSSKSAKWLLSF